MKRRTFIQSLTAVFSLPAIPTLSLGAVTSAVPTTVAAVVPAQARSWAVYISTLHGECPPHALQTMLNIPAIDAKKYVTQLVADGIIKPNPLLQRSVSKIIKGNEDSLLDKIKKRSEMKAQNEAQTYKKLDETECLDTEVEWLEDFPEVVAEDEVLEEDQVANETDENTRVMTIADNSDNHK